MHGYKYAELILFKLRCPKPQCGHEFEEVIADLMGRASIPCPFCNADVGLQVHKRAIEHFIDTAAQLDILERKGQ
jgi:hypothetical protein